MRPSHTIVARLFVQDIRSGLKYDDLMRRYHLTEVQLNRALQKLIDAGILTESQVSELGPRRRGKPDERKVARDLRRLMATHRITLVELLSVIEKMRGSRSLGQDGSDDLTIGRARKRKRTINAREFAEDVQLGMDLANLMAKYRLTEKQIDEVIDKLIGAKLLTEAEIYDRTVPIDTTLFKAMGDAQNAIDELE